MALEFEENVDPSLGETLDLGIDPARIAMCKNVGGYTWAGWIQLMATPTHTNQLMFVEINSGSNTRFEVQFNSSQLLQIFARAPDAGGAQTITGLSAVPVDTVNAGPNTHLACVADFANDRLDTYINGVLDNSAVVAFTNAATDNTDPDKVVYCSSASAGLGSQKVEDSKLSDCRTYKRALNAAEIKTLYHMRQHDGLLDDLETRYRMDDSPGGVVGTAGNIVGIAALGVSDNPQAVYGTPVYRDWNASHRRKVC